MTLSRRDLIKASVFAGAAATLPIQRFVTASDDPVVLLNRMPTNLLPAPFTRLFRVPPTGVKVRTDATTDYYRFTMRQTMAEIVPGFQTPLYTYEGTFPGPTIKATRGREVVVRHVNELPAVHQLLGYEPYTSVHLHGSPSLPQYDGYASDITYPGQYKDYRYPGHEASRTLWYHDHGVHHTAENVFHGLAAMYVVSDPADAAFGLPAGEFDVPLIISDTMLRNDGQLLFSGADDEGHYGDMIMVNGTPWPRMDVKRRKYRFRVLNASIARSYNWSLSTGHEFHVIGTDGGLVPVPMKVRSIRHGMAERYEVVIDFARYPPGTLITLRNRSPKNNVNYANTDKIMQFRVVGDAFDPSNNAVPATLFATNPVMTRPVSESVANRSFDLRRENGQWTVNGKTWEDVVDSGFTHVEADPEVHTTEIWTVSNLSGGWFHPFHIHLVDFRILDRNGQPPHPFERGPKDVVYVGEAETVRLIMNFERTGKYMMHCHNLVHEDHDMMTQFEVTDPVNGPGPSPFSAPAQPLPESAPL